MSWKKRPSNIETSGESTLIALHIGTVMRACDAREKERKDEGMERPDRITIDDIQGRKMTTKNLIKFLDKIMDEFYWGERLGMLEEIKEIVRYVHWLQMLGDLPQIIPKEKPGQQPQSRASK